MTWLDQTFRFEDPGEVSLQPDGTVELSWGIKEAGSSRVTILLTAAEFRRIIDEGRDLLMVGAVGPAEVTA